MSSNNDEMLLPKIIPLVHFEPERETFEIVAKIKNNPGSLSLLLSTLSREGIDIVNSLSYSRGDFAVWIAFVQPKNDGITEKKLEKIVESSPSTVSSTIGKSVDGFLIENLTFPVARTTGERQIVIRAEFFRNMMRKMREEFQSAADVFLYKEGVAIGEAAEKSYLEEIGSEKLLSSLRYFYEGHYSTVGWARAELVSVDFSKHLATVRLYDNFECPPGKNGKPYSHFLRGFISGSFDILMGVRVSTKEVRCVSKGDAYCEFQVSEMQASGTSR